MRQLLGSSSFGCKRQGLKEMDRSGCPRAFWILARTAPPAHPGQDSSDESSEDMGEGTSEGGIVLASASISQLTIPVTDMSVGPVSGEASGSLSGELKFDLHSGSSMYHLRDALQQLITNFI
ncbi:uncharacterized protein LOC144509020 isoform X2 [Mustelus asterias]